MPSKKRSTKRKTTAKKTAPKAASPAPMKMSVDPVNFSDQTKNQSQTFNLVVGALVLVVLAMGYVKFKHLLVPAVVNGSPIYSWQFVKALNQTAGKQVIDQLIVEKLIAQEADAQNITLTQEEIDAETARLDEQFATVGGLDAFLSSQGLDKADIQRQLELNLKVQKIVADKVNITDEDVDTYYQENITDYSDVTADEAKTEIRTLLTDEAMQQQVGTWIQDLRAKGKVTINLPSAAN